MEATRMPNGLYHQWTEPQRILKDFYTANEFALQEIPVDLTRYGKYDITAIRDGDPEPCPRKWDPRRRVWSDDWKDQLFESEI